MDKHIQTIIKGGKEAAESLQCFVEEASQVFEFPELNKNNQRKELWEALFTLAKTANSEITLMNCFIAIRILSREKMGLNELITDEWFKLMQKHSGLDDPQYKFDASKLLLAIEVEKCLCNVIFNSPVAAGLCCKNGVLEQLTERIKNPQENKIPEEIRFYDVKLIFLLTALCSEVRSKVKEELKGVESLLKMLDEMLKEAAQASPEKIILDDQKVDLACEILKALFNVTLSYGIYDDKEENEQCDHLVTLLRMYLLVPTQDKEKGLALKNNVINLLTNMPDSTFKNLITPVQPGQNLKPKFQFEGQNMTAFYEILMVLKSKFNNVEGVTKQYEILCPVVTILLKSANSERAIRKYLRLQILPPLKDVHSRPEQGSTLRNHLCRLLTTPITQLRDLVADLLFILCKKSVKRMIKYTGYGNAAGLFAKRGLLGGRSDRGEADYSSGSEGSETEEYAEFKHGINPVIGCYEEPHPNAMENMTEEQKEYEAMKLVELMDSLTRSGTIQPCRVGEDGKPHPIKHVLQLQEGIKAQQVNNDSDSDD
ncbi:synembryn-A [Tribolium castaneum]|uniref:Synembryn-like Protein n=1 Tax=Tribolium castaneum TaxID=7070 RepID=D7ELV7_TRICA|nr:PREDICTED: synembryn-A [Tribolium castaneum]EFA12419.2 Synembryn-like Protein [Tribolium castaneum]|eukprot:XP_967869.2 PREDICTED: synembryn-A [Tribolium castaneum]